MSVRRHWRGSEVVARIEANVRKALGNAGLIAQTEIKLMLSKSASPSAPGQPPGVVTAGLRDSVQIDKTGLSEPNPFILIGPGKVYARILEYGGTIVPKTAKALAVPIGRKGRLAAIAAGGNLRSLDLVYIKRKGKPPLLARKVGKKIEPLFVLKPSVTIAPRPYMAPSAKAMRGRVLAQFTPARLLA